MTATTRPSASYVAVFNDAQHSREDKHRAHDFLARSPTPLGAVYREQIRRVRTLMDQVAKEQVS